MAAKAKLASIESIALEAIQVDGGHHKQWYLERILKLCGWDSEQLQKMYPHEEGIPD